MSTSVYAKIERGDSTLNIERLEQIAQIFNIDIADLMSQNKGFVFVVGGDYGDNNNIYHYTTTDTII
ncbi:MAG: helix-turn-helix transcriptional regulator [Moraxellaceae bacterium]|nr:helix-turn-helix transcriptional regulator [Moraxellaceae bacterium]